MRPTCMLASVPRRLSLPCRAACKAAHAGMPKEICPLCRAPVIPVKSSKKGIPVAMMNVEKTKIDEIPNHLPPAAHP
eukprot:scaffold3202_cov407-Prasinococcus_capsulatus_cf.AAC.21